MIPNSKGTTCNAGNLSLLLCPGQPVPLPGGSWQSGLLASPSRDSVWLCKGPHLYAASPHLKKNTYHADYGAPCFLKFSTVESDDLSVSRLVSFWFDFVANSGIHSRWWSCKGMRVLGNSWNYLELQAMCSSGMRWKSPILLPDWDQTAGIGFTATASTAVLSRKSSSSDRGSLEQSPLLTSLTSKAKSCWLCLISGDLVTGLQFSCKGA